MKEKIPPALGSFVLKIKKKYYEGKHVDLLLTGEGKKKTCSYFNTFMYDYTLCYKRKHFCY